MHGEGSQNPHFMLLLKTVFLFKKYILVIFVRVRDYTGLYLQVMQSSITVLLKNKGLSFIKVSTGLSDQLLRELRKDTPRASVQLPVGMVCSAQQKSLISRRQRLICSESHEHSPVDITNKTIGKRPALSRITGAIKLDPAAAAGARLSRDTALATPQSAAQQIQI